MGDARQSLTVRPTVRDAAGGMARPSMGRRTDPVLRSVLEAKAIAPGPRDASRPGTDRRRVAILIDPGSHRGCRVIAGIRQHLAGLGADAWRVWLGSRWGGEPAELPDGWSGDGVIADISTASLAHRLSGCGVPVVNVGGPGPIAGAFPSVGPDADGVADVALRHFLDRGFREIARVSSAGVGADWLGPALERAMASRGMTSGLWRSPGASASGWRERVGALAAWVAGLPRPVGIVCAGSACGREVIEACALRGIRVPEDIAVLCDEDDEVVCELTDPPMSGVMTSAERVGSEAARLLALLMDGGEAGAGAGLRPQGVASRRSTETLAVSDPEIAEALRFIRDNAARPIQVSDVLGHVRVSRRSLERRFAQVLDRSPAEEIRRVRLSMATRLLLETDLSIPDVASRCGFGTPQYLSRVFGRQHGVSPQRFRRRARA